MPCVFCRRASAALNAAIFAVTVAGIHHLSGMGTIAFMALVVATSLIAMAVLAYACGGMPARSTSRTDRSLDALTYGLFLGAVISLETVVSNHVRGPTTILYLLAGPMVAGLIFTIGAYASTSVRKS